MLNSDFFFFLHSRDSQKAETRWKQGDEYDILVTPQQPLISRGSIEVVGV